MFLKIHGLVRWFAWLTAILGGFVLAAVIVMICLSITGRTLSSLLHSGPMQAYATGFANWLLAAGIGPIRGDFELLEASMPFIIFSFLVWCQLSSGHATVDIFTDRLRPRAKRVLRAVTEIGLAAALVLVAMMLHEGMAQHQRRGSTTFVLQFPLWWSFFAALIPAYVAAGMACYVACIRAAEAALNRPLIPSETGADH